MCVCGGFRHVERNCWRRKDRSFCKTDTRRRAIRGETESKNGQSIVANKQKLHGACCSNGHPVCVWRWLCVCVCVRACTPNALGCNKACAALEPDELHIQIVPGASSVDSYFVKSYGDCCFFSSIRLSVKRTVALINFPTLRQDLYTMRQTAWNREKKRSRNGRIWRFWSENIRPGWK